MKNTEDCGCVAYSSLDWREHEQYGIQYCALHEAAPALLAALERLVKFSEELCSDVNVSSHYPSIDTARAALRAASALEPQ